MRARACACALVRGLHKCIHKHGSKGLNTCFVQVHQYSGPGTRVAKLRGGTELIL